MVADRADLRSLLSDHDMTAVGALPDGVLVTGENHRILNLTQQLAVTLLMGLLNGADFGEEVGDLIKAFLLGGLGEAVIHVCPFEILTISGISQIDVSGGH